MALVSCPDCGQQISDRAPACPKCGHPMAATVIEKTGKGYKKLKIIGGLIFFISLPILLFSFDVGIYIMLAGVFLYVVASFQAWYNHG
jgi:hypothetical protein